MREYPTLHQNTN